MKSTEKLMSHFTATGFVLNNSGDKILFIFHKKLQKWLPPGGHIDEGELPHEAVVREVFEETGVQALIVPSQNPLGLANEKQEVEQPCPMYILHEYIPEHNNKKAHLHYDFIFALQATDETISPALGEVEHVHWFSLEEILRCDTTDGSRKISERLLRRKCT